MNTGIDTLVYYLMYWTIDPGAFLSKTVAFFTASIFSYFANVIFTFKPKNRSAAQFSIVMFIFGLRWLISASLAWLFDYGFINWLHIDFQSNKFLSVMPSLLASALLIPIAYFALDWIFRKTGEEKEAQDL